MSSLCEHCCHATFNGFPPEGSPEWEVGTVYFWCEQMRDHHLREHCGYHVEGEPRRFDKRGREIT